MTLYLGENLIGGVATPIEGARNIGQIITSTIPLTDAGLHLLDGALISGSGSYADFVTYIVGLVSTYPDLFETEANWQTSITNYGVCGKFVYDSVNNTVRLPKITGFIEGTTDTTALGNLIQAGLPNITGTLTDKDGFYAQNVGTGAFLQTNKTLSGNYVGASANSRAYSIIDFDASRSNSIYGNSSTVQPQSIKVLYYICIATSTKTNIQVDIDKIATDLNGKVDKNDLATVHCVVETYQNDTSWYRVYDDGWCEQGGLDTSGNGSKTITLLKEFINTKYSVLANSVSSTTSGATAIGDDKKTTTSFGVYKSNTGCYWRACGYIS